MYCRLHVLLRCLYTVTHLEEDASLEHSALEREFHEWRHTRSERFIVASLRLAINMERVAIIIIFSLLYFLYLFWWMDGIGLVIFVLLIMFYWMMDRWVVFNFFGRMNDFFFFLLGVLWLVIFIFWWTVLFFFFYSFSFLMLMIFKKR